ncbi:MAG: hypothetical protein H3Z50_02360 [archaeon]|nr:hypothetical protein [archaeon]
MSAPIKIENIPKMKKAFRERRRIVRRTLNKGVSKPKTTPIIPIPMKKRLSCSICQLLEKYMMVPKRSISPPKSNPAHPVQKVLSPI